MIKYWRWERHTASDRILDIGGGIGGTVDFTKVEYTSSNFISGPFAPPVFDHLQYASNQILEVMEAIKY